MVITSTHAGIDSLDRQGKKMPSNENITANIQKIRATMLEMDRELQTGIADYLITAPNGIVNPFYGDAATIRNIFPGVNLVKIGHGRFAVMESYKVASEVLAGKFDDCFLDTNNNPQFLGDMGICPYRHTKDGLCVWNSYYFTIVDTPENRQNAAYYLLSLHKEAELAGGANLAAQESARRLLEV